jgi:hypothetical protein
VNDSASDSGPQPLLTFSAVRLRGIVRLDISLAAMRHLSGFHGRGRGQGGLPQGWPQEGTRGGQPQAFGAWGHPGKGGRLLGFLGLLRATLRGTLALQNDSKPLKMLQKWLWQEGNTGTRASCRYPGGQTRLAKAQSRRLRKDPEAP